MRVSPRQEEQTHQEGGVSAAPLRRLDPSLVAVSAPAAEGGMLEVQGEVSLQPVALQFQQQQQPLQQQLQRLLEKQSKPEDHRGETAAAQAAAAVADAAAESDGDSQWSLTLLRLELQQQEELRRLQKQHAEQTEAAAAALAEAASVAAAAEKHQVQLLLMCMLLVGFFVAAPDSILGASAAQDVAELNGLPAASVSSTAALINAMGAVGALLQGNLTAAISEAYGWDVLFGMLCVFAVFSGLLLLPAALAELKKKPASQ
ncbi:major facilitator superfamily [Cyclospora cayetanensis]|uniref:Major facilitator superfamily n=1 Tax=Cyclospora cayetanensis TaxID=88456 RepID=A0A1D3CWU4_9EIME|nr:major facilitator superfamily [Cyclospora cayetanensis]